MKKTFTIRPNSFGSSPVTIHAENERDAAIRFAETVGLIAVDIEIPPPAPDAPFHLSFTIGTGRKFVAYDAAIDQ
ncbi:hypothetical protein [Microvirga sp. Mcv34]|uniref:hypothetical protein n=1 Tax=Microvirga sp. Mcv34 TaxID=2926016 RepID=UPI0021C9CD04|nr:hypothetical protein [Microvirga sp. Mcv34]